MTSDGHLFASPHNKATVTSDLRLLHCPVIVMILDLEYVQWSSERNAGAREVLQKGHADSRHGS